MVNKINIITSKFGTDYKIVGNNEIAYCCPYCQNKRGKKDLDYKLYVNTSNLIFHCFKCQASGKIKIDLGIKENSVYSKLLSLSEPNRQLQEQIENDTYSTFYVPDIKITRDSVAYNYLINRGIDDDKIDFYNIKLGIKDYFGRIIIPNMLYGEWTDMFSARTYLNQIPKYQNPIGCKKTSAVFNLHNQTRNGKIYIVEGAITAICAGKDAVCLYGSSPDKEQVRKIAEYAFSEINCVLDNDPSGRKGQYKLLEMLSGMLPNSEHLYACFLQEGIDAADIGEKEFKRYVKENRIQYDKRFYKYIDLNKKGNCK